MMENGKDVWMQLSPTEPYSVDINALLNPNPNEMPLIVLNEPEDWIQQAYDEEDTRDVAHVPPPEQPHQPLTFAPVCPQGPPARGSYSGDFDFEVRVSGEDTHKKKYLYSHKLNRIYVDIKTDFAIHFVWNWDLAESEGPMLVRATTVFSDESQFEKRVERCLQHVHDSNNVGSEAMRHHVLQSTRPPNTEGVHYCGEPAQPLAWYSVAVQFPRRPGAGAAHFTHAYCLQCKSSCNSGINRRSIEVVFTLEDARGAVRGRQSVGVRVCSCPRRDLKKDEEAAPATSSRKRAVRHAGAPEGKRVKQEFPEDTTLYPLPAVAGFGAYQLVLPLVLHVMQSFKTQSGLDECPAYDRQIKEYRDALEALNRRGH